jgi:hypothetical protein
MTRTAPVVFTAALAAALACAATAIAQEAPQAGLRMSSQLTVDATANRAPASAPTPVVAPPANALVAAPAGPVDTASRTGISEYRIGPEDLLEVQVYGVDQLARTVRVNSSACRCRSSAPPPSVE